MERSKYKYICVPGQPVVEKIPGDDSEMRRLTIPFRCHRSDGKCISAGAGWKFDGASIPDKPAEIVGINPDNWYHKYSAPSAVHDLMYERRYWNDGTPITREEADQTFYDLLIQYNVSDDDAGIMYYAVRKVGWFYWYVKFAFRHFRDMII